MEVISVCVGRPTSLSVGGKSVESAIVKQSVEQSVYLAQENFEGDEQADLVHHGGPDKAVCAYPHEHYAYWEAALNIELPANAFGENLLLRGLPESDVRIGDTFRVGEAILQVSQPRIPCGKISMRNGVPHFAQKFKETGYTGYYLRVLQEGAVAAKPPIERLERGTGLTIAEVNQILFHENEDPDRLRLILQEQSAAKSLHDMVAKQVARLEKGGASE